MGQTEQEHLLADLSLTLEGNAEDYNYNKTSSLQGVLMEHIDTEYAEVLHQQGRKPYSQCLEITGGRVIWHIYTLSSEAYRKIILPLSDDQFTEFELRHDKRTIKILDKQMSSLSIDTLFQQFYTETAANIFKLEFHTPTAFKKNGAYCFYPDIFNIYQSLMMRFDEVSDRGNMFNQDTLEQLAEHTEMIGYSLHSLKFELEGVRIPAFMGSITVGIYRTYSGRASEKAGAALPHGICPEVRKENAAGKSKESRGGSPTL